MRTAQASRWHSEKAATRRTRLTSQRRKLVSVTLCGLLCLLSFRWPASAASTLQPDLKAILGSFNCIDHESGGVTWRFHSVNKPWGSWVRFDTTFAPQNGQAANATQTYIGYDTAARRWNIVSVIVGGSYYTRHSRSGHLDGSRWVDDFPADGATAVLRAYAGPKYTFDLTTPAIHGHAGFAHVTCVE